MCFVFLDLNVVHLRLKVLHYPVLLKSGVKEETGRLGRGGGKMGAARYHRNRLQLVEEGIERARADAPHRRLGSLGALSIRARSGEK